MEHIGLENAVLTHKVVIAGDEKVVRHILDLPTHEDGLNEVTQLLTNTEIGVIKNPEAIDAVGHRVVHGGESFSSTTVITKEVKEEIKKLFPLAPLHNPANYPGIEVAEKTFNKATQVAVFDTAFHQTMPETAFRYGIPKTFYATRASELMAFMVQVINTLQRKRWIICKILRQKLSPFTSAMVAAWLLSMLESLLIQQWVSVR